MRLVNFKGAVVRQIVQRSKELRVECNRAGHTYVEMGDDWHAGHSAAARALDFECPA
jgi:hypothetical protein